MTADRRLGGCRRGRPGTLVLAVLALTLLVGLALPAAGTASPYLRALGRVDNALRFAIERQPEGLAKSLAASERVCSLGQQAEQAGDQAAADADWSALSQAVERLDEPGLAGVERAFGTVGATLGEVESRFSRAWRGQPDRVRGLRQGARAVRRGLRRLSDGFGHLRDAFAAWHERRCEGALAAVDSFSAAIPGGMAAINVGMWRLLSLAEPSSLRRTPQGSRRESADGGPLAVAKNRRR